MINEIASNPVPSPHSGSGNTQVLSNLRIKKKTDAHLKAIALDEFGCRIYGSQKISVDFCEICTLADEVEEVERDGMIAIR